MEADLKYQFEKSINGVIEIFLKKGVDIEEVPIILIEMGKEYIKEITKEKD